MHIVYWQFDASNIFSICISNEFTCSLRISLVQFFLFTSSHACSFLRIWVHLCTMQRNINANCWYIYKHVNIHQNQSIKRRATSISTCMWCWIIEKFMELNHRCWKFEKISAHKSSVFRLGSQALWKKNSSISNRLRLAYQLTFKALAPDQGEPETLR